MIVCICNKITDKDIEDEINNGCKTFEELQDKTGLGTDCGCCRKVALKIFNKEVEK
jgi:bacterioferritin-associated ferredoxin